MTHQTKQLIKSLFIFALAAAGYFWAGEHMPEAARRVLFVFIWAALFWALEIIPLYATSLLSVLLLTFLLCKPGGVLGMDETGYTVFLLPFGSSIIMLFLGGLVMAVAMQKYEVDQLIASKMLKVFGTNPYSVLCGFMLCTAFLSMWMSNTAATAMMIALLMPLVKQLDASDLFRTGLILSVPFAANIGGMATPIGTPPNAIAIGILGSNGIDVSFLAWMRMALPLVIILLFGVSVILKVMYPSQTNQIKFYIEQKKTIDVRTFWVMGIVIFTIGLWLTSEFHYIPSALIALVAVGLFTASGLLNRDDLKKIEWDVLILMWGGLALGKGLEISGLSQWIVTQPLFDHRGILLVVIFCITAMVMSTFISNTATANLIVPIAVVLPGGNPMILVTMIALACSLSMALPISTPPNAIAFSTQMLKSRDMLKAGLLISIASLAIILIGFQLMIPKAFGFWS